MNIIGYRKIYFTLSGLLVAGSIAAVAIFGLRLGIDFTGGSLMEIKPVESVSFTRAELIETLTTGDEAALDSVQVQISGESGFVMRFKDVTQAEHQAILSAINNAYGIEVENPGVGNIEAYDAEGNLVDLGLEAIDAGTSKKAVTEERFESIGPIVGTELKNKAIESIIAVLVAIILYVAWAFRKVSEPVSSWKYGVAAVVALIHDVTITTGVFAVLGYVLGVEIDILFVTALLTILGFSVNDTIVVFDRTRENLSHDHRRHAFEWIVNTSVSETMRRSIYTSATALLILLAVFFFGGESVRYFMLALIIGISVGTYSSIFLASPLLVTWEKWGRK